MTCLAFFVRMRHFNYLPKADYAMSPQPMQAGVHSVVTGFPPPIELRAGSVQE